MDKINAELLITLVEQRPVIWDKTLECYKEKRLRESAWKEICGILDEEFLHWNERQRQEFARLVLKKWTTMRDSWKRAINKHIDEKKFGVPTKPSRLYIYHDQMSFLKKIIGTTSAYETADILENNDESRTDENEELIFEPLVEQTASLPVTCGVRRRPVQDTTSELDTKIMKLIDLQTNLRNADESNHHISFFKGILPSLSSLNDDQTLEFQGGVIKLLQDIKRKNAKPTS